MISMNFSKRKIFHLIFIWFSLLIMIFINIMLYVWSENGLINNLVMFISLIMMFVIIFVEKPIISDLDMKHRYHKLLESRNDSISTNCLFDLRFLDSICYKGYTLHISNEFYTIYYRIKDSLSKKSFIKTGMLELITIIHSDKIDFYADVIEQEYKKIWFNFEKEKKLNKQISIQIKKFENIDDELKNELNRIIAYKEGDNYLININCGFISSINHFYFLHSDSYSPNVYYKYAG